MARYVGLGERTRFDDLTDIAFPIWRAMIILRRLASPKSLKRAAMNSRASSKVFTIHTRDTLTWLYDHVVIYKIS